MTDILDSLVSLDSHPVRGGGIMKLKFSFRLGIGIEMITEEMQDVKGYLDGLGVKFSFRQDYNENAFMTWANSNHFRVRISYQGRTMHTWFYQGQGVKGNPTIDGVIECLLMDRACSHYGLKEFGNEFGWDEHTLETFKACVAIGKKLERVLGVEVLDRLDKIINGY